MFILLWSFINDFLQLKKLINKHLIMNDRKRIKFTYRYISLGNLRILLSDLTLHTSTIVMNTLFRYCYIRINYKCKNIKN